MSKTDPALQERLELATRTLEQVRPDSPDETLDMLRASGLLESALEVLRCALGDGAEAVTGELALAAQAASAVFETDTAPAGLEPDGVPEDDSPRNPWTLVRGLYAGVASGEDRWTTSLAQRGRADAFTDLVTVGAELRRCALMLAALLRGDPLPESDEAPGDPAPDPEQARLWTVQIDGIEALAADDSDAFARAVAETERVFDAMYAEEPPSDPDRWLRLPVLGMQRLADFVADPGGGR
jgi:hypothetical protein